MVLTGELAIWRLPDGVTLHWRWLDGEAVVRNDASGQTHVLDSFSEWVLREIEKSPDALEALASRVATEADIEEGLAIRRLREVLAEFDKQGLAEAD